MRLSRFCFSLMLILVSNTLNGKKSKIISNSTQARSDWHLLWNAKYVGNVSCYSLGCGNFRLLDDSSSSILLWRLIYCVVIIATCFDWRFEKNKPIIFHSLSHIVDHARPITHQHPASSTGLVEYEVNGNTPLPTFEYRQPVPRSPKNGLYDGWFIIEQQQ